MQVITLEIPHLGNRCHLVHDGRRPWWSTRRATWLRSSGPPTPPASRSPRSPTPTSTTTTSRAPSAGAAARRRLPARGRRAGRFERVGVRDGDVIDVGGLDVTVLATPGHTRHHQSFLAATRTTARRPCSAVAACCTAPSAGPTSSARPATPTWPGAVGQRPSARRLEPRHRAAPDPRLRQLLCERPSPAAADTVTIGDQLHQPGLLLDGTVRRRPGRRLRPGARPTTRTWAPQPGRCRPGPSPSGPPGDRREVTDAVLSGAWVVDLRGRGSFADGHLPGSVNVEYGDQFATYVGWLVPWDDDLVLLCDGPADSRPGAARPGRDRHRGAGTHVLDPPGPLAATYRRADWSAFRARPGRSSSSTCASATSTRRAPARRAAPAGAGRRARPRHCPRASSGALPVRLPGRHRRQRAAPGPPRRARRRQLGPGRRAGDPDHDGRSRRLRPAKARACHEPMVEYFRWKTMQAGGIPVGVGRWHGGHLNSRSPAPRPESRLSAPPPPRSASSLPPGWDDASAPTVDTAYRSRPSPAAGLSSRARSATRS